MDLPIGVVSVLYRNSTMPELLNSLAQDPHFVVSVVDNSGECAEGSSRIVFSKPGRNLGYTRGINAALAHLPKHLGALVVVNPDISSSVHSVESLVSEVAGRKTPTMIAPSGGSGSYGRRPIPKLSETIWAHLWRHPTERVAGSNFYLSGAFLILNSEAINILIVQGRLLREDLFFMDDVELSARAGRLGVDLDEVSAPGDIIHIGGVSTRQRPGVFTYFSRVSKIRYWAGTQPWASFLLTSIYALEGIAGIVVAVVRRDVGDGSRGQGFWSVLKWIVTRDAKIDEAVLGN